MIGPIRQYCRDEVAPRLSDIVISVETLVAVGAGVWLALIRDGAAVAHVKSDQVAGIILTYSTMAFGFSLAGLTIALTLPDHNFARYLATTKVTKSNAYSDLLFVFSWTAIAHWLLVVVSIGLLAALPTGADILPSGASTIRRAYIGLSGALVVYGVSQFLITLITLSQVGNVYISRLGRPKGEATKRCDRDFVEGPD